MKIKIVDKEENRKFFIWFPTHLVFNSLFASLAPVFLKKELEKYGMTLNGKNCRRFVKTFYRARKHFGGRIDLVNVKSKDGSSVEIIL